MVKNMWLKISIASDLSNNIDMDGSWKVQKGQFE